MRFTARLLHSADKTTHTATQTATAPELTPESAPLGLQWDGRDRTGRVVPGGTYIYQIHVGSQRVNGTVVVVR